MSSTNKTANLELSQYVGSDKPTYLVDYNGDMAKIDAGYAAVKSEADATDLAVSSLTSTVSGLSSTVSDQGSAITGLRTDTDTNTGSINTITSLIGNGEPTTTDKTIIGAINELAAEIPSPTTQLPATSVSYDNQVSGLTADDVQEAIDELASKGVVYTLAERKIGKFGNDDLYEKSYKLTGDVTDGQIVDATLTDSYVKEVVSIGGSMRTNSSSVVTLPIGFGTTYTVNLQLVPSGLQFIKSGSITLTEEVITVRYTKAV